MQQRSKRWQVSSMAMLNSMTHKICDGYPLSKALNVLYGVEQEELMDIIFSSNSKKWFS